MCESVRLLWCRLCRVVLFSFFPLPVAVNGGVVLWFWGRIFGGGGGGAGVGFRLGGGKFEGDLGFS